MAAMPKTGKNHHARKDELPSTLQRSDQKAQDTFAKTYDSAVESYDDERRAAQTAYASLKHSYEKVGDHWEAKDRKGPSDKRAEEKGAGSSTPTAGGVDANTSTNWPGNWTSRAAPGWTRSSWSRHCRKPTTPPRARPGPSSSGRRGQADGVRGRSAVLALALTPRRVSNLRTR